MYREIRNNIAKTFFLLTIFIGLVLAIGYALSIYYGSPTLLYLAAIIAVVQSWIGYFYSDKIALAASGAKGPLQKTDNPTLWNLVENLSIGDGLPMPKVYIIQTDAMNAFATGRDPKHASVAVTTGLMERLTKTELEGVLAHELSHVKNYDIRVMSIVVVLVGVISFAAHWFSRSLLWGGGRRDNDRNGEGGNIMMILAIIGIILAPIAATLIQLAVSRSREYLADASGALLTRYPEGLASALKKLENDNSQMPQANQATAHLFITNPFKAKNVSKLFSTHPPLEDRINRLEKMEIDPS